MITKLNNLFIESNDLADDDESESRKKQLTENILKAEHLASISQKSPYKAVVTSELRMNYDVVMKNKETYKNH